MRPVIVTPIVSNTTCFGSSGLSVTATYLRNASRPMIRTASCIVKPPNRNANRLNFPISAASAEAAAKPRPSDSKKNARGRAANNAPAYQTAPTRIAPVGDCDVARIIVAGQGDLEGNFIHGGGGHGSVRIGNARSGSARRPAVTGRCRGGAV